MASQTTAPVTPILSSSPETSNGKIKRAIIFILIFAAATYLIGGFIWIAGDKAPQPKACTQEAKECPDGSFVGRTGPNCEFSACPVSKAAPTPSADPTANWKTYESKEGNFTLKYPEGWYFLTAQENFGLDYKASSRVEILFSTKLDKNGKIASGVNIDPNEAYGMIGIGSCQYRSGCEVWTEEEKFYDINNGPWKGGGGGGGAYPTREEVSISELGNKKAVLIKRYAETDSEVYKENYGIQYNLLLENSLKEHLVLTFGSNQGRQNNNLILNQFNQILQTFKFID